VLSSLQDYLRDYDVTIPYDSVTELAERMHDRVATAATAQNVLRHRRSFTLGARLPELLTFVERVRARTGDPVKVS
jgi:hypothetical protein